MNEFSTFFYSDGHKLDASFYLPDGTVKENTPVVVACSGFLGLKNIHPERFARWFSREGYVTFGFDYRGFAASEGEPGHVVLEEQVRDIRHAIAFVRSHEHGRGRPVVLVGWGMAGGLVLNAVQAATPVAGVVAFNGFYDAMRVQHAHRGEQGVETFLADVERWEASSAWNGKPEKVNPFDIYPLDPVTRGYVDDVLYRNPDFGPKVSTEMAASLLAHAPERNLSHLAGTPLLILHGDRNALHPPTEAERLHEVYPGPKELRWVENAGHTEWMLDDHPTFQGAMRTMQGWVESLPRA